MKNKSLIEKKRESIDELDALLINLLVERFDLSKEISFLKKEDRVDNYDPKREEKILENIKKILIEKKSEDKVDHILSIYKLLLLESKSYQSK